MDGGMLSQDEINALLSGMDLSDDGDAGSASGGDADSAASGGPSGSDPLDNVNVEDILSDVEKDAIGEVANISMGSSATTLYSLVNRKVNITTPVVEIASWNTLLTEYEKPCVFIQIKYTMGLDGTNILVLKEHDVKVITDLMMGGDGTNTEGELGELHLSAISEAMNQMMGSAATSLSTMLKKTIDISPPDSTLLDLTQYKTGEDISPFLGGVFVKVSFRMQIDELVDSSIMQLYPVEFARDLVATFLNNQMGSAPVSEPEPAPAERYDAGNAARKYEWHADGNESHDGDDATDGNDAADGNDATDGNDAPGRDDAARRDDAPAGDDAPGSGNAPGTERQCAARPVPKLFRRWQRHTGSGKYRPDHGCAFGGYGGTGKIHEIHFRNP